MDEGTIIQLGQKTVTVVLMISAPILGVSLLVGLVVSIFQAVTQINEMTLTFVPKILGIIVALVIFGPWMISTMVSFTTSLFDFLPELVR